LITNDGYYPNNLDIKAGEEITLTVKNENAYSCAQSFTIPKFGIETVVEPGTEEVIKFTAPSDLGKIAFTCSMGMYRGIFNVVE
jgi:plastocyanin domain-containing protein